jgi:hypothetical protein
MSSIFQEIHGAFSLFSPAGSIGNNEENILYSKTTSKFLSFKSFTITDSAALK